MKRLFCILFALAFSFISQAQFKKEKVYSLVKEKRTTEWYTAQAKLWKEHLSAHPQDEDAWLNYYTAMRMLRIYQQDVSYDDLGEVVKEAEKAIPNTFVYHYIAYWNIGLRSTFDHFHHLEKAYELEPNRIELFDDLFTHYETLNDKENAKEIAKQWFQSNDISSGLYAWNYNMLASTEQNAIIITAGDNDTYPALILQYAKDFRTDVAVLNQALLTLKRYREAKFKELGIPQFTKSYEDFDNGTSMTKALIGHIKEHAYRPLYFAVSISNHMYEEYQDEVHNVGMAYKWSKEKFDNIAVLKKNYEKHYLLDYLKIDLQDDLSQGVVDQMSSNYLVSLLTLVNHYKESGDPRHKDMAELVERIAQRTNNRDKVAELLGEKPNKVSQVIKDPRTIEEHFQKINDTLLAQTTEVTNELYELFLTDLLKQKRFEDLQVARAEQVDWKSLLHADATQISDEELFKNGHPDDEKAPVVNITYEGAVLFCEWLTDAYNNLEHKKKKYDRVTFRLPTKKEWIRLAQAGNEGQKYPWPGENARNSKGCFLANVNPDPPGQEDYPACSNSGEDGGFFTVRADAYLANDFGLYCMSGNVAEMVQENGTAMGGSWANKPEECTTTSEQKVVGRSPYVGFRVIMVIHP